MEKAERQREREREIDRWRKQVLRFMESTYPEIYEFVAGNETDADRRGGKNGRERAVGLQ